MPVTASITSLQQPKNGSHTPNVVAVVLMHELLFFPLVQSQGYVYRSCALLLAKASGRPVLLGGNTPYLD
jgi:hypothetical protein